MLEGPDDIDVRRVLTDTVVSGQIIPLSQSQYYNYTFVRPRDVPDDVLAAIDAITYPAERECCGQELAEFSIAKQFFFSIMCFCR